MFSLMNYNNEMSVKKLIKSFKAFNLLLVLSLVSVSSVSLAVDVPVQTADKETVQVDQPSTSDKSSTSDQATSSTSSEYVQSLVGSSDDTQSSASPTSTTQLAITVAGLFAVIGMIFVAAWLVRRLSGGQFGQGNAVIKILATQPIGTKERICLIDVGGQQVLVGITAQSMQTLMVLDQPIDLKSAKQHRSWSSSESVNSVFGAKLQSMLKGTPVHEVKKSSQDD